MRATDFLSATALSKKTSATLEALEKGEAEKLIILKNNAPKAILLSIEHYETRLLGDYAYGIGTVIGTEKNLDTGKMETVNSRESILYKKQNDGEWKVLRLMVNQNQ